ncbi:P-loop containing nucleoside triphosphate hydrolase protein [Boletus reticuloceps]|uniref:DNA 3'-5' helicase n=1 Tax=Boletus reticuloceps TaxID=495285 RepID=A0A8I3AAP5_9AGAM|nr:P-loop containing nucleoside triphosphate hydrolase protein [Boletus reticuloceps]
MCQNFQAIENLSYCVVVISPEQVMKDGGGFEQLLKKPQFTTHINGVVIDKAHCISTWGQFRPKCRELGQLRYIIPDIPFLIASATLSSEVLQDIKRLLHLWKGDKIVTVHHNTDWPHIKLAVKRIQAPLYTYADLSFLVLDGWKAGDSLPPKFLIFFDNITTSIEATQTVRLHLPPEYRHKIKWFNVDMSAAFKGEEVTNFAQGDTWGFFTTESFGMGFDMPDIQFVGQWCATCSLATLWQHFGRAVRDMSLVGTAVLFCEQEYFDQYRKEKEIIKSQKAD